MQPFQMLGYRFLQRTGQVVIYVGFSSSGARHIPRLPFSNFRNSLPCCCHGCLSTARAKHQQSHHHHKEAKASQGRSCSCCQCRHKCLIFCTTGILYCTFAKYCQVKMKEHVMYLWHCTTYSNEFKDVLLYSITDVEGKSFSISFSVHFCRHGTLCTE